MATTPVVPSTPVASAASSAPSPASTPTASPAIAAPVAPQTTAPHATGVPPAADGSTQQVDAPAASATAAKPEPKQTDFPGDVAGFLEAHNAWEREGGETNDGIVETEPAAGDTQTDAEDTNQSDTDAAAEVEPTVTEPEAPVTPESLNALMAKSPELKAALDASPEVKNALFTMARINAKAAPILEIMPNVEAAQFAAETSNKFVSIRSGFMDAVDNPEALPDAYSQFASEFAQRDADGKPVLDAQGNPVYDQDFHMLNDFIVDSYHGVEIDDLEAQATAGNLSETDELALQALKFIKDWKSGKAGSGPDKPNLDGLTPEARAYIEKKEQELAEREAKLGGKEKAQTAAERKAARQTFETNIMRKIGGSVGSRLQQMVAEDEKAGVFIPSYVTQARDPETGISVFAQNLLDRFMESTYGRVDRKTGQVVGGVAHIRNTAKMLAQRPPSPEAEKARLDFHMSLVNDHLPGIYEKERRKVQTQEIEDRKRAQSGLGQREKLTAKEPRGGNAPAPRAMDAQSAMKEAYAWVDQNHPDLSPPDRLAKALLKKDDYMAGRR